MQSPPPESGPAIGFPSGAFEARYDLTTIRFSGLLSDGSPIDEDQVLDDFIYAPVKLDGFAPPAHPDVRPERPD